MKKKLILLSLSTLLIGSSSNIFTMMQSSKGDRQWNPPRSHTITPNRQATISSSREGNLTFVGNYLDMTQGDVARGKQIFIRHLQRPCAISAGTFSAMHSQEEWEAIVQAGEFEEEILKICPQLQKEYNPSWSPNLYQFVYEYANDTGNVPSC